MLVVQRLGGRRVGAGLLAWALLVDLCLFFAWTRGHGGISDGVGWSAYALAFAATIAAGLWVGARRRVGTAFGAPLLAWFLLVPFAFASGFVTSGFLGGLGRGILLTLFGGFLAAFAEGVLLVGSSVLGRLVAGQRHEDVTILPPGTR